MSIKSKIAFIFFMAVVLMITSLVILSNSIFQSKFIELERDEINKNEKVFLNYIDNELKRLKLLTKDWGQWNDTFHYVNNRNSEYEKSNLGHDSLQNLQIDLIAYTKNDKILNSLTITSDKVIESSEKYIEALSREVTLFDYNKPIKGIIDLKNQGIWLVSTTRVTDSTQEFKRSANLLMAIKLDDHFFNDVSSNIQVNLTREGVSDQPINEIKENNKLFHKFSHIKTLNGKNLVFSIKHYPSIAITGQKSFITFILLATFFVSVILGLAYLIIERRIFTKIIALIEKINNIDVTKLEKIQIDPKNSNQEILSLAKTINALIDRVQQDYDLLVQKGKFESLGLMAGGVAHEINNPITVIKMNNTKLIKAINNNEEIDLEDLKYKLEKNLTNINRITGIITGMKKLSRQSATDKFITSSANEIIKDVQSLEAGIISDKDIETTYSFLDEDVLIEGLPPQIIQIIINLIVNSSHAISDLDNKWIKVEITKTNNNVNFNVTDSGNGISEENAKRIMDPFFTTKDVGKGTGLGLSICKKIAHFHKGELILDMSSKNTKFILSLPIHSTIETKIAS